jgi:hypothetical protein
MPSSPHAVVDRLFRATNDHDVEAIVACFSTAYQCSMPLHPERSFTGCDQVRRNWTQILAGVPDLRAEVVATAVAGDMIWVEQEHSGTRRDGRRHLMRGIIVFHVVDDAIDSARFYLEPVTPGGPALDQVIADQLAEP